MFPFFTLKILLFNFTNNNYDNFIFESTQSPNGKVLLSVRDSPEVWVKSVKNTIFSEKMGGRVALGRKPVFKQLCQYIPWLPFGKLDAFFKTFEPRIFGGKPADWTEEGLKMAYLNWIQFVKKSVPENQLLIFNVKEGWKPICTFLDVPGTHIEHGYHLTEHFIYLHN